LFLSLEEYGLTGEPTARDAIRAGATIVTMSGDKLLGGPQAGLMLGSRTALEGVRKNPLTRSYRVDKLTLAALEATLALYRDPAIARREIPALAQLTASVDSLRERAERIRASLPVPGIEVVSSDASVGGGAFPTACIPSIALAIAGRTDALEHALRSGDPPVIARAADARLIIDLRTIMPGEDDGLTAALRTALG
jgi:L-seryl-tRNA(Ser) seleniumtransferase